LTFLTDFEETEERDAAQDWHNVVSDVSDRELQLPRHHVLPEAGRLVGVTVLFVLLVLAAEQIVKSPVGKGSNLSSLIWFVRLQFWSKLFFEAFCDISRRQAE
jgi:hypothetical protein